MMQEVEVLKTIPELVCSYFSEEQFTLSQENTALTLDDDAVKIILSTKGTMDDVSPEMQRILDYIDGKGASDKFTEELEEAV